MPVSLAKLLFWVAATVCLFAHAAILRSVLRVSTSTEQRVSARRKLLEIAWAVLPVLVLAAVLLATWRNILRRS